MGFPRFSRGSCCLLSRLPAKLGSPEMRSRPKGFLRLYSRHFSAWGERWFARTPKAASTRWENAGRQDDVEGKEAERGQERGRTEKKRQNIS